MAISTRRRQWGPTCESVIGPASYMLSLVPPPSSSACCCCCCNCLEKGSGLKKTKQEQEQRQRHFQFVFFVFHDWEAFVHYATPHVDSDSTILCICDQSVLGNNVCTLPNVFFEMYQKDELQKLHWRSHLWTNKWGSLNNAYSSDSQREPRDHVGKSLLSLSAQKAQSVLAVELYANIPAG